MNYCHRFKKIHLTDCLQSFWNQDLDVFKKGIQHRQVDRFGQFSKIKQVFCLNVSTVDEKNVESIIIRPKQDTCRFDVYWDFLKIFISIMCSKMISNKIEGTSFELIGL